MILVCSRLLACMLGGLLLAAIPACSDDGLSPTAGGTGLENGSSGGTGSVSTTVTASAGSGGGPATTGGQADDDGPAGTLGVSDSSGADDGTGVLESTTHGDPPPASTGDEGAETSSAATTGGETGSASGDTGGLDPGMPCVSHDDCVPIDDCCACTAAHVDDPVEACEEKCDQTQCAAAGISGIEAECVFGQCQLHDVPCNGAFLLCDALPPDCPDGMLPSVDDEGSCWTGACVPAEACDVVPDCSWCGAGQACVQTSTQVGPLHSCWPVDPSCEGEPSCACMAEVCTDPFQCGEGGVGPEDLGCFCPVCG